MEGSQASPACPSDQNSIKMKISVQHLWNDAGRGKPTCWEKNLSQHHFVHHKFHGLARDRSREAVERSRRLTARTVTGLWSTIFVEIMNKNSVPTSQRTSSVSITKSNQLMLFREIIVYIEDHARYRNTLFGRKWSFSVKANGTSVYHPTLQGWDMPVPVACIRVSPFVEEVLFRTPNHVRN